MRKKEIEAFELKLTEKVLSQMYKAQESSDRDGIERGFTLCAEVRQPTPPYIVTETTPTRRGTRTGAPQFPSCKPGLWFAGKFHTHPRITKAVPSLGDLLIAYTASGIACNSGSFGLCCYVRKWVETMPIPTEEWNKLLKEFKEDYSLYEEWEKTRKPPADGRAERMKKTKEEMLKHFHLIESSWWE